MFICGGTPGPSEDPDAARVRGGVAAVRGDLLAGAGAARAGLRGDPARARLGRALRHEPARSQRHRRAGRRRRNFYLANGFSGHGLQQSPAVGRGAGGTHRPRPVLSARPVDLGYERIAQDRPLLERNVI